MSGSNPGDPPDDSGDRGEYTRDRQGRSADDNRSPPGESSDTPETAAGPNPTTRNGMTIEDDGVVRWFLKSEDGTVVMVRDILGSVAIVAVIGLILFGISGIWPPLVAVESGSMEPNMQEGDLIFVVADDRFVGDGSVDNTGVVPLEQGAESGHEKFNGAGDVIIFQPNGNPAETPVIHRAHFWVEEGENWVDTKADEEIIGDATCDEVYTCPAKHDGFITKGDNNDGYDQYGNGISDVVRPDWVTGKAMFRIPWLGHVRLAFDSILGGTMAPSPVIYDDPAASIDPRPSAAHAGLAGATGIAGTGAGVAVAIGRHRT
ncbi:S24/S26 family peptidase [Natronorubrum halophilum]|uniref:S26 family signal peptidase n=1 Tax=Natronorubrum halophilum TaxID=1702106 RepID=UPI000EF709E1|nr:S26 family signal peptidase [Natronorubrum halophilum]